MKKPAHVRFAPVLVVLFFTALSGTARALESVPTREDFLKLIDRPKVDPKVELGDAVEADGLKTSHFWFYSEENEHVPGIAVYPSVPGGKLPCVIVMHGTGGSKENELPLMKKLARRGCVAVAIDGRFHGERLKNSTGTVAYNQAILSRFKGETKSFPMFYDTVYDVMRLVDILCARDDIDSDRLGIIGISKGGVETYLVAAADPRLNAVVPCIGVQSFKWGVENDGWHGRVGTIKAAFEGAAKAAGIAKPDATFVKTFLDKVLPGIDGKFDGPEMLPLIAPRPLLIINGDSDGNTPLPGVMICAERTKAAYAKAGAPDKFKQIVEAKTGHKVTDESMAEAIEFLAKNLNF